MSRHFIQVDGRWVHYRRWGEGPVVLAIHGSPQSSRAMAAVGAVLVANGFCVIAPDTPGNGLSTPLSGAPTSSDYAEALLKFADALGLGRFGMTGYHTGAATICVFAAQFPERVSAVVCNGLSCWTGDERRRLLDTYLPPFVPAWDGSHMAWLWSRLEEQTVFFPWNEPTPAARMLSYGVPGVAALHSNALDFLESGDGYRAPYASAFAFRAEDWLPRLTVPHRLVATEADPLRPHLDRAPLRAGPSQVFADSAALYEGAAAFLGAHPGDPAPRVPESGVDGQGLAQEFVDGLAWRGRLTGAGRPLVLLHDAGGAARAFDPILAAIASQRPVVAIDLPGHGAAEDAGGIESIERVAGRVAEACAWLGLDAPAAAGVGFGATVARVLAPDRAVAIGDETSRAGEIAGQAAPSLAPEWDGAHLLRAFRIARWEALFRPWYRRDESHAIAQRSLDPADIHGRALDLVHAGQAWTDAVSAEIRFDSIARPPGLSVAQDAGLADALARFAR